MEFSIKSERKILGFNIQIVSRTKEQAANIVRDLLNVDTIHDISIYMEMKDNHNEWIVDIEGSWADNIKDIAYICQKYDLDSELNNPEPWSPEWVNQNVDKIREYYEKSSDTERKD